MNAKKSKRASAHKSAMPENSGFETFGRHPESWFAAQRKLVMGAVQRGWIIPPTIETSSVPENAPAGKCATQKARRPAQNGLRQRFCAKHPPTNLSRKPSSKRSPVGR